MEVPQEAIFEFKELYKKKTGKDLTDQEAETQARKLLTLMRLATGAPNVLP